MGFEISYTSEQVPTNADILRVLRTQYPDKDFTMRGNTIVESYRTQPDYSEVLARWKRVHSEIGVVATAPTPRIDLDRMMTSDL